jgi:peptidyl-prolyl cis-trans isomerase C
MTLLINQRSFLAADCWLSIQSWNVKCSILYVLFSSLLIVSVQGVDDNIVLDPLEQIRLDRINMKPWFLKSIPIGTDFELPVSPITIIIGSIALIWLVYFWKTSQEFADASHILITDVSNDSKEKLIQWKTIIGSNLQKFNEYAYKYSTCPSGKNNNGRLGKFRKGDMVPQFDTIVFNINTPEQTTIGPIQTNFGYHLIFIHSRQLAQNNGNKKKTSPQPKKKE